MKKWIIVLALAALTVWITMFTPEPVFNQLIELERQRHGVEHKTVEIDSETWHYLEGGDRKNPTVVMIHGYGADKDNWMRFSKHLVDDYHVIAPDLYGFGESPRDPQGDYRLNTQVERLNKFLTTVGITGKVHMVGNSMGGNTTGLYALTYPNQVITAGFFNSAGVREPNPSPRTKAFIETGKNMLVVESVDDYDRLIEFVTEQKPFMPPAAKRMFAERALANRDFNERIMGQLVTDVSSALEKRLPQITMPTLVMWGKHDRAIDVSTAAVFHAKLPNSELEIYDDVGHLPMVEVPERSALRYKAFIDKY